MSTQLVRLAAAVLSSEKGRKTVGWVLAAILSPVILLTAFLCCVGSGTAEHNSAVVSAAFYGTELSASVPEEYRMQLTQMRGSFSHLDAAVAEVNQKAEGNRLDPIQVKAVFFALCFGADTLSQTDAEAFVACFCETETRGREETGETYEVAVPLPMEEVYAQLSVWQGRAVTAEERSNAVKIYSMVMGSAGGGTYNGAYEPGGNAPMELEASLFTDPATKNSADLAIYAANAWNSGWGYVWGTFGQVLTPELLQYKISQYPEGVGDEANFIRSHWLNRRTTDCVGLIKGYGWLNTETMEIQYGSIIPIAKQEPEPQEPKPFALPKPYLTMRRMYAYLTKHRCIDRDVVTAFVQEKLLYEDDPHHNCVFVGLDENGEARHAHLRSTGSQGKVFRINVESSDIKHSFHKNGTDRSLYVFEAPIDLLSHITLYPAGWLEHSYVACCGTSIQPVLERLRQNPKLDTVYLCLDNDEAGEDACDGMLDTLEDMGYDVERLRPEGKDWNDDLRAKRGGHG